MGIPRKDVRALVEPEVHSALTVFADIDQVTVAEYVERLITADVSKRVRDATLAAERLRDAGISWKNPEQAGITGKGAA
jgi:hypothetical protein